MLYAMMLSAAAGLSTALGGLLAVLMRRPDERVLSFSLGFAGGVMMTVSLSDILPHVFAVYAQCVSRTAGAARTVILCFLGMAAAVLLQHCVPDEARQMADVRRRAAHTALVTLLAVTLHNLPEGVLTMFSNYADPAGGLGITLAVALHNIPEGLAIAVPVYYASGSRMRGFSAALFSGLAEPAGAAAAFFFLKNHLTPLLLNGMNALIAGMMLWVSAGELIPEGFSREKRGFAAAGTAAGILVMSAGIYLV